MQHRTRLYVPESFIGFSLLPHSWHYSQDLLKKAQRGTDNSRLIKTLAKTLRTVPRISKDQHHTSWYCHKEAANTHKSHKATQERDFSPLHNLPLAALGEEEEAAPACWAAAHHLLEEPRGESQVEIYLLEICPHISRFKKRFFYSPSIPSLGKQQCKLFVNCKYGL